MACIANVFISQCKINLLVTVSFVVIMMLELIKSNCSHFPLLYQQDCGDFDDPETSAEACWEIRLHGPNRVWSRLSAAAQASGREV